VSTPTPTQTATVSAPTETPTPTATDAGSNETATPTATPTATSTNIAAVTATVTAVAPTATPTPTPTPTVTETASETTLSFLNANLITDAVKITWQTALEVDSKGFYIYRRNVDTNSDFAPHSSLVASKGTVGGLYEFVDEQVVDGTTYEYLLVERKTDDSLTEYVDNTDAIVYRTGNLFTNQLYLPMIVQSYAPVTPTPISINNLD